MDEMFMQLETKNQADAGRDALVHRHWLVVAHIVWVILAACALLILSVGIPLGYVQLLRGSGFHVPIDAPPGSSIEPLDPVRDSSILDPRWMRLPP